MSGMRQPLGRRGENFAARHYERAGYTILARNWRHEIGELDLVAQRGSEIVFVEVRARRGPLDEAVEWALSSVHARKQARLVQLAEAYLATHDLHEVTWRIDVVAVGCQGSTLSMKVIEHAVDW